MAFVSAFSGLSLRTAAPAAISPQQPTCMAKKKKAAASKPSSSDDTAAASSSKKAAASPAAAAAPASATLHPRPSDAPEQYYPTSGRNLAPHIVFVSDSAVVLDNCAVEAPLAAAKDDLPAAPAAYSAHFPKKGDTLNWAPHIALTPSASSVGVAMTRVAEGKVSRVDAPDPKLFEQYFPAETRDLAPEIVIEDKPGSVLVEMSACEPMEAVVDTDSAVKPAKFEDAYPNDETLHMAPHISMSEGVLKCAMKPVWVDPETVDRPAFEAFPQYEAFGGLNRAPVISIGNTDGEGYTLGMTMEDMPSFVSYNAAPVIEFTGVDGREGIKCQMTVIEGDASAVDTTSKEEVEEAPVVSSYSPSWKPASSLSKAWV